jgi:hypothetical protein
MATNRGWNSMSLWQLSLIVVLTASAPASADLVFYSDFESWNNAVSSVTTVTIPDPTPDPFIFFGTGSASISYGDITFSTDERISDSAFYNVGSEFSGLPAVLSSQNATTGPENILISFPGPVLGVALNYGTFEGGDVTFTLSNGTMFTLGSLSGSSYDVPSFVGFTDLTSPFSSVRLTSSDFALNLNSVSYAGTSPVPEPRMWVPLAVSSLVYCLCIARRERVLAKSSDTGPIA